MKKCTRCGKLVAESQIVIKLNQTEEDYEALKKFIASSSDPQSVPPRVKSKTEGHTAQRQEGQRRKNVCGGWRMVSYFCGPLRDLTSAELSE
jgi:hypothetical protein